MNPAQLGKTNSRRKIHPPRFRSFSTSRLQTAQVEISPDNKPKGRFLPQFLRNLSFRSATSDDAAADKPTKGVTFLKTRSLSSYFSSRRRTAGLKDGPEETSRWAHVKRVRRRIVNPLKSLRDSYVDCMTAAAGNPRLDGLSLGFQGPMSANHRSGFESESFCPRRDEPIPEMVYSGHRRSNVKRTSLYIDKVIPEETTV